MEARRFALLNWADLYFSDLNELDRFVVRLRSVLAWAKLPELEAETRESEYASHLSKDPLWIFGFDGSCTEVS